MTTPTIRQRLLVGTLSNVVGKVTSVGVWFVLTPFVLGRLGPNGYALWVLMGAVASYGFLLDFGIGGAVVKYVAEHVARGERDLAKSLIASAQWLYLALALVALVLSILIAPALARLLGVAADQRATVEWLVILTGMNVAITIAFMPPMSVLRGLQRYDLYNGITVVGSLVEAIAAVAVLLAGWGVVGMVAAMVPVNGLAGIAALRLLKRVAPDLPLGWQGANRADARRILSFSSSLFAIDVARNLQAKTDEFIIVFFRALSVVTPYALARKLGDIAELAAVQFVNVIMPLASELDAGDHGRALRTLYIVASRVALAIAVPLVVVLVVIGGHILTLWVGRTYAGYANLLAVLAIARLLATSQWPAAQVLLGMSRHRFVAATAAVAGLAHVALSVLLLSPFGLMGIAVGTLIPYGCTSLCVLMPFAHRTLQIPFRTAVRDIWSPGLLPGIGAAAVLWGLQRDVTAPSIITVACWILVTMLVYGAGYLMMPATGAERRLLADLVMIGSRWRRRRRPGVPATCPHPSLPVTNPPPVLTGPYRCPRSGRPLHLAGTSLWTDDVSHAYPIRDGIPVFLAYGPAETEDARKVEQLMVEDVRKVEQLVRLSRTAGCAEALKQTYGADSDIVRYATRTPRFLDLLRLGPSDTVLEIGTGLGQFTPAIAGRVRRLHALEVIEPQARFAKLRCEESGATNVEVACGGDDCRLPYHDGQFDAVIANLVFEWCASRHAGRPHPVGQATFLREAARVLKPGGVLYLSTKNRYSLHYVLGQRDEHAYALPFGNALPRWFLTVLLRLTGRTRPMGYLYSHRGLRHQVIGNGFAGVSMYCPAPEPRYPERYVHADATSIAAARRGAVSLGSGRFTAPLMKVMPAALVKHFTYGHVVLARTPGETVS